MGSEHNAISILHDRQRSQLDVGQRDSLAVNLDPHPLEQGDLDASQPHCDRSSPAERQRVSGIVGDPDWETGVSLLFAVLSEQIFATALKVEDSAVKCFVVRIPEDCAHSFFQLTLATALALLLDQLWSWRTLVRACRSWTFWFAIGVAGATVAPVFPDLAYGVGQPFVAATDRLMVDLSYGWSQGWKVLLTHVIKTKRATLSSCTALISQWTQ